jgi:hypothetical protein
MLKRAWLLLSGVWALLVLYGGSTRGEGIMEKDLVLGFAPLVLGWLLARGTRYVVTGTPVKPARAVFRRP